MHSGHWIAIFLGSLSLAACRSASLPDRPSFGMGGRPGGRPVEAGSSKPVSGMREVYYWNGHNDALAYRAFEAGESGGTLYPDLTTKLMTETGRAGTSFGIPPWQGARGYWDVRFKDGPYDAERQSNTALEPEDSVTFTFSVVPSGVGERQATYGEDYRFVASDWATNGYPVTGEVLQPDDPDAPLPSFTQTIPAAAENGDLPIYGVKIRFQVRADGEHEAPETFWTRVDEVRIEPGSSTRMKPGMSRHAGVEVSRSIMRLVIVDEEAASSTGESAASNGFRFEPAPHELWADLAEVPTRLVSETGAGPEVPRIQGASGECYPWRLLLPRPTEVTCVLTLVVREPDPARLATGREALASRSDFNVYYDHGGGPVRAVQTRAEPLTFAVRVPAGASEIPVLLQAVDDDFSKDEANVGAEAVYLEARSLKDLKGGEVFPPGDPVLVRFLIVEEGPVRGRRR